MDEFIAACMTIAVICLGSLLWAVAADKAETAISQHCADYGKFQVGKKWYECKPSGN